MDRVFDHEDSNNRPEEIPMDDLNNLPDDEFYDAHGETSFISGGGGENENILADDTNINCDSWELKRKELLWQTKVEIVRSAILDVTGKHWDARLDSSNTRDFLNNIEVKGNKESIWYKGKIVY